MGDEVAATSVETPRRAPGTSATAWADPAGPLLRWLGDAAAAWVFVMLLPLLADNDGGWGRGNTADLAVVVLAASPWLVAELRRTPRTFRVLTGTWVLALSLGVVFSGYRADVTVPLMQYAMAPMVVLATLRLWRRAWGPGLLLALVLVAFLRFEWDAWLVWQIRAESGEGVWRTLSWHNQTAALGGMIGAWSLGIAMGMPRLVRVGLGVVAALALSGVYLSGSRAGLACAIGAVVVTAIVGTRASRAEGHPWRYPLLTVGGVLAGTAVLVVALLGMQPPPDGGGSSSQPLTARDQSVGQNTRARVHHVTAGLGMLAADPLTGGGIGSYGTIARAHNSPAGGLTVSAHNEYVELAAETGIVGGLTLLAVAAAGGWLVLARVRRPGGADGAVGAVVRDDDPHGLRRAMATGATGALAMFLVHSAVDFDWAYPVLFGLAAMALAVLVAERPGRAATPPATAGRTIGAVAIGVALVAVLAGATAMARAELAMERDDPVAWDDDALTGAARSAIDAGRPAEALAAAERSLDWNPASPSAIARAAEARFLLDGDVDAFVATVEQRWWWFSGRTEAVAALADAGESEAALAMADRLLADLETYRRWGVTELRLDVRLAQMTAVAERGCAAVDRVVTAALAADEDGTGPLPERGTADTIDEHRTTLGC